MRKEKFKSCCLTVIFLFGMQSLADLAQKESERRKQVEMQGLKVKVIEGNGESAASNGSLTTSTLPVSSTRTEAPPGPQNNRASIRHYRNALQKLDKVIRQDEMRLESLRARLQAERRALPKIGRLSPKNASVETEAGLQEQIEELLAKLKQAREERSEIYQAGKKDGYLPGELDGKGIIP